MRKVLWCGSFFALPLALLSGVLLALALPPRNLSLLGWVAFIPLLIAAGLTPKTVFAAGYGMLAGIACGWFLAGHDLTITQFANLGGAFASLGFVLAFVAGVASYTSRRIRPSFWPVVVACAGVVGEFWSVYIFPVNIALCQHATPGALRLASLTGVWGVTFLLWMVPASIIAVLLNPRRTWPVFAISLVLLAVVLFLPAPHVPATARHLRVAAVQAPDAQSAADLTRSAAKRADVVVWPEQLLAQHDPTPFDSARENSIYLVASSVERVSSKKKYNSAVSISPEGKEIGRIRKSHLFGKEIMQYRSGKNNRPVRCGSFTAGTPICFDTEFTDICRRYVREGANILLVPNSDPDMPSSLFNHLHAAIIPFRAAENGVPVVWTDCSGLSSIFDGTGRVIARAPVEEPAYVTARVALRQGRTMYNRVGDILAYIGMIYVFCAVMALSVKHPTRRKGSPI